MTTPNAPSSTPAYRRAYYAAHRARRVAQLRAFHAANPGKQRLYNYRHKLRLAGIPKHQWPADALLTSDRKDPS